MDLNAASSGSSGAGLFLILFAIAMYLLPTIIANIRGVPNRGSVAVLNIFLGWTFVGWIVSLAMAAGSKGQNINIIVPQQLTGWNNGSQYGAYNGPQQPQWGGNTGPQMLPSQQAVSPYAAPGGWFPEPTGTPGVERYFDGHKWTADTRPAATV